MPKRMGTVRRMTKTQGDDAWVEFRRPEVGEIEDIIKLEDDAQGQFGAGIDILVKHIRAWNWVDYDGSELPSPKEDPSVVRRLTADEYQELISQLLGSEEQRKN